MARRQLTDPADDVSMEITTPSPETTWADAWESPASVWADLGGSTVTDLDESTATIHGVTGAPVVVAGLDREPTLVVPIKTLRWGQALRHRLLLAWTGLALLALASVSVFAAVAWQAPSAAGMAGGFGLIGSLTMISRSVRS